MTKLEARPQVTSGIMCRGKERDTARLEIDPYRLFLVLVFSVMGIVTGAMLWIAVWLFRRNRRLPRLVKPKRHPRDSR